MNKTPLISALNLSKTYETLQYPLFHNLSLDIHSHDTISCTGRSGEGKSTLLHILGGIEPPSSGTLHIQGKPFSTVNMNTIRNEYFGFIFQSFHLLDDQSTLDNVLLPVLIARKPIKGFYRDRAHMLIAKMGIEHRSTTKAKCLSGGEKQRVAIARALIMDPHIIFADEPTGNLDSLTAAPVIDLLFEAIETENKALFLVTHQEDLAIRCKTQYVLSQGKLC